MRGMPRSPARHMLGMNLKGGGSGRVVSGLEPGVYQNQTITRVLKAGERLKLKFVMYGGGGGGGGGGYNVGGYGGGGGSCSVVEGSIAGPCTVQLVIPPAAIGGAYSGSRAGETAAPIELKKIRGATTKVLAIANGGFGGRGANDFPETDGKGAEPAYAPFNRFSFSGRNSLRTSGSRAGGSCAGPDGQSTSTYGSGGNGDSTTSGGSTSSGARGSPPTVVI